MNKSNYRNHVISNLGDYLNVDIYNLGQPKVSINNKRLFRENSIRFTLGYLDDYLLDSYEEKLTTIEKYELIIEYMENLSDSEKRNYLGRLSMDFCDTNNLSYSIDILGENLYLIISAREEMMEK